MQKSQVEGLDVVPADKNLAGAAVELVLAENREYKLQGFLKPLRDKYKFIVLDCPPALDLLTLNALVAADAVIVPIQCEYLALEGVSELLDTLMRIRRTLNPSLEIEGIVLTMYDERTDPLPPGRDRFAEFLWRPGVSKPDSEERPACGGAKLR